MSKRQENKMKPEIIQNMRYGAHGVVLKDSKLLLTQKKSGPYKGLWGLPGGAIEFGETPEETLKRELLEEAALEGDGLTLLCIATHFGEYDINGQRCRIHHIGIVYQVKSVVLMPNLIPEEEGRWIPLEEIKQEELTPFAKQIVKESLDPILTSHP